MEVIYVLIPGMIVVGMLLFASLVRAVRKGQYEDMEGNANRILQDDDDEEFMRPPSTPKPPSSPK